MRQEDFILREIQKISELLLGLIGKLIRKKEESIEETEAEIETGLAENFEALKDFFQLSAEEIIEIYKTTQSLTADNLELLANLLFEMGVLAQSKGDSGRVETNLTKAIAIYEFIDAEGDTFSFMRNSKLNSAKEILEQNQ